MLLDDPEGEEKLSKELDIEAVRTVLVVPSGTIACGTRSGKLIVVDATGDHFVRHPTEGMSEYINEEIGDFGD